MQGIANNTVNSNYDEMEPRLINPPEINSDEVWMFRDEQNNKVYVKGNDIVPENSLDVSVAKKAEIDYLFREQGEEIIAGLGGGAAGRMNSSVLSKRTGKIFNSIVDNPIPRITRGSRESLAPNVRRMFDAYEEHEWGGILPGYGNKGMVANKTYSNDGRQGSVVFPKFDSQGRKITYKEFDINPKDPILGRDAERFIKGSDGSVYYTNDHYKTAKRIK